MSNELLDLAIAVAVETHKGQTDKAGEPYILHPLRVMLMGLTQEEKIVGVLHDTLETNPPFSNPPLKDLLIKLDPTHNVVLAALYLLTRSKSEKYFDYIQTMAPSPPYGNLPHIKLARQVKLNDVRDNMVRLGKLDVKTNRSLYKRYSKALHILLGDEKSS